MTGLSHETLTAFAQTWGLLYLIALAAGALAYTFWPKNRARFDRAKNSIMDDESGPWV